MFENLGIPTRIELARAKMTGVLDHFLYLLELHANNRHVVYSPLLSSPTRPLSDGWEYQEYNRRRFPVVGREDRWQRLVPEWLWNLFPPTTRAAVKRFLSRD